MIKQEYVNIKINNKSEVYRYSKLGYNPVFGTDLEIKISDLPMSSSFIILATCDICENDKEISYKRYNITTSNQTDLYTCSQKCSRVKNKRTLLEKYGVDNISKLEEIKNKKVDTCRTNFGVDYPQQCNDILQRSLNTKELKYGDRNWNNPNKMKETNLLKYGFEYAQQSPDIIRKQIETMYLNQYPNMLKRYESFKIIDYKENGEMTLKCDNEKDHNFDIFYKLLWNRSKRNSTLCTICNPIDKNISGVEISLLGFIKSKYSGEIITTDRSVISPYELDIFLPELKIAFEFNGLYWHSDEHKDKNYHLMKTNMCEEKGISLIHIWEDDWVYKQDIIKSIILNKIGLSENKIYARNCHIEELDPKTSKKFLDENHLQGNINASIKIGLFYNKELISIMTFGKSRSPLRTNLLEEEYEMYRFCNKINHNIVGGMSKLLKYFIKNYKPKSIISYADRSISVGNSYEKLGFIKEGNTLPGYHWIVDGIRTYRYNWRKDKLVKMGFDSNKTEDEIMKEMGNSKIWNPGNIKYKMKLNYE